MTLLDLEKAFDRVWIDGLLYKMHKDKFNVNFIKLRASYLKDRHLKVKVNNTSSTEKSIESGVPQDSILGPALLNYYKLNRKINRTFDFHLPNLRERSVY
jgi:retron-type reverse transcriptase